MVFTDKFELTLSLLSFQNIYFYSWPILSPYFSILSYKVMNYEINNLLYPGLLFLQIGLFLAIYLFLQLLRKIGLKLLYQLVLFINGVLLYLLTKNPDYWYFVIFTIFSGITFYVCFSSICLLQFDNHGKNKIGSQLMYLSSTVGLIFLTKVSQLIVNNENIKLSENREILTNLHFFLIILSIFTFLTIIPIYFLNEPYDYLSLITEEKLNQTENSQEHPLEMDLVDFDNSKSMSLSSISDFKKTNTKKVMSLVSSENELQNLGLKINEMLDDDNLSRISTEPIKRGRQISVEEIKYDVNLKQPNSLLLIGIIKNCSCLYIFFNCKIIGLGLFEDDKLISNFITASVIFQFFGYAFVDRFWAKYDCKEFYSLSFILNLLADFLCLYFYSNKFVFLIVLIINRFNLGVCFKSDINTIFLIFNHKNIVGFSKVYFAQFFCAFFIGFFLDMIRVMFLSYSSIFGIFVFLEFAGFLSIKELIKKKNN